RARTRITTERRAGAWARRVAHRPDRCGGVSVQGGAGLAEAVQPAGGGARPAADRASVVRLAEAVAHGELAPVVGVHVLLQLVRPEQRGRRADLVDPLGLVGRAGLPPGRQPLLLQQPDRVLA